MTNCQYTTHKVKVFGEYACFTRPEMKVERVSYDVMTPSAARAIFEAILWKPEIRWQITKIDVLNPIKWQTIKRNEIASKQSIHSDGIEVEDVKHRQQRSSLILKDVAYVIHGYFELTEKAKDPAIKYSEMFERRLAKGQCFYQPYLGCREFSGYFEPVNEESSKPLPDLNQDLGYMLYDMDYGLESAQPMFFRAKIEKGSIIVPDLSEVKA